MLITSLIVISMVSGFIGGWLIKRNLTRNAVGHFNHVWENRYKALSKERSQYVLKTNQLDGSVGILENKLISSKEKINLISQTFDSLQQQSTRRNASYQFDQKSSLKELNRLREIITSREVRLEQCQQQIEQLTSLKQEDERNFGDLSTRYCVMQTEVERLRDALKQAQSTTGRSPASVAASKAFFQHDRKQSTGNVIPINSKREDLQQITGIGPVTENKLNRAGVVTLRQLAEISTQSREAIQLKGRINWDLWIENAQSLLSNRRARKSH